MKGQCGQLQPCALALALGIVWGLSTFIMGLLALWTGYGAGFLSALGALYIGYEASYLGSLIGLAWGFLDAAVFGFLVAWLYNAFNRCCRCEQGESKD